MPPQTPPNSTPNSPSNAPAPPPGHGLRPREKILSRAAGPATLSDAELLALLLRTGLSGRGVVELAGDMLKTFGGHIHQLLQADMGALSKIKGLGPARAAEIMAVAEIARRINHHQAHQKTQKNYPEENQIDNPLHNPPPHPTIPPTARRHDLSHPLHLAAWLQQHIAQHPRPIFAALMLDGAGRLLACERFPQPIPNSGVDSPARVYPREIVLAALGHEAAAVVLAYHRATARVQVSDADRQHAAQLAAALALIDVRMRDYVILGENTSFSLNTNTVLELE